MKFVLLMIPSMRERGETVGLAGSDRARFQILQERLREQVVFAEQLGYDGFCMTEQHLQVEGIETTTNPILWDYFVARHTERMRVGQLGMNLSAVNPIKLAEDLAMLDHFTGGRTFVGFSRGNTARWVGTFGQHLGITSTESDKSENDRRNRLSFVQNWEIVKRLWTQETVRFEGDFWQVPPAMEWHFGPTDAWGSHAVDEKRQLREIGIVPRPLQEPHPPVYAPLSYSMESVRFWAREGGKMVSFVAPEREEFNRITLDEYEQATTRAGRRFRPADALAVGGHLVMGRTPEETEDIWLGFKELFDFAYDAPPYHVPMGRLWKGTRQEVLEHVAAKADELGVDEVFLWHHVGYFPQEQELAMLNEFAEGVIVPLGG